MLASISDLIGTQPILAFSSRSGVGYAVGQVNILGFSLGVGAVLFVGLFLGAIAPKAQVAGPIGLVGLIMFLYGIGILYGRQFFEGLSGAGRVYNLLAFVAVVAGLLACALGLGAIFDVKLGHTLGIFAGSMTSTATLQAALDTIGNREPSIGYSVAYPFGVIGPILCFYFLTRRVKPSLPAEARALPHGGGDDRAPAGRPAPRSARSWPRCRRACRSPASGRSTATACPTRRRAARGDALLVAADRAAAVDEVAAALGRLEPGRIAKDRGDLSYQRFFVSKAGLTGMPLAELPMPEGVPIHSLHVRRYDVDLVPSPDLMLEIGDRVGVLVAAGTGGRGAGAFR